MASVHKKGGSGGQTNFEIRLRIMFSYKDFISSMKPGIFMDVEIRNRSGLSDLSQNRPKFWPYGFEWESSKGKIGVVTMDSSG